MSKVGIAVTAGLSVIFLVIIIVLAAVYGGDDANCDDFYKRRAAAKTAGGPPMVHYKEIAKMITMADKLGDTNAKAYMRTIGYSQAKNKDMQASVLRLDFGPALKYTHWYESILFVMSGSFRISNGTGKFFTVGAKQSLFIPRGSEISYESLVGTSFMYIVDQPPVLEHATGIQKAISRNPTNVGYPGLATIKAANAMQIKTDLAFFGDAKGGDLSYLTDFLFSTVKDAGMTGGLYKLLKGPHLDYTYPYEEFKYILEGEFHLTDGTGQKVVAKAGDLMYFPNGCPVKFEGAPTGLEYGYGFFVGQRAIGEA